MDGRLKDMWWMMGWRDRDVVRSVFSSFLHRWKQDYYIINMRFFFFFALTLAFHKKSSQEAQLHVKIGLSRVLKNIYLSSLIEYWDILGNHAHSPDHYWSYSSLWNLICHLTQWCLIFEFLFHFLICFDLQK